jgi:hypothetical protein
MPRAGLIAFGLGAQIFGTICPPLDSIRTPVRLPKEGVALGDSGFIASPIFQWANVVGSGFLFAGFALQGLALRWDRSQSPSMKEERAMAAPQREDTSITPNVGEL